MKFSVFCDNIRSAYNVGSIFRTSDALAVEFLYLSGITPTPENKSVTKTSLGAEKAIKWEHVWRAEETFAALKKRGYSIVALEQTKKSKMYSDFKLPKKLCLVVGNEVEGVSPEVLKMCDAVIEIPMLRTKESLNVATSFAVVGFDFLRRTHGKK